MDINRLKELYDQLDELQQSGKDVVYEIEKEINNIELGLLQETIIPTIAKSLANKLKPLTCQVEVSLQYDGDGKVKYSFGKSGSMVFVQNEVEADDHYTPIVNTGTLKQTHISYNGVVDKTFGSIDSLTGYKGFLASRNYKTSTCNHYIRWLLRIIQSGLFTKYSLLFEHCSDKISYLNAVASFIQEKEIAALNIKSHNSLRASLNGYIDYLFEDSKLQNVSSMPKEETVLLPSDEVVNTSKIKRGALKVTYPNGTVISNINNSTETFLKVISDHYPELIQEIGIFHSGVNLVMNSQVKGMERRQKFLPPNWYVFVNLNTEQKADDLRKISDSLDLNLKVEVIPFDCGNVTVQEPETVYEINQNSEIENDTILDDKKNEIQNFINAFALMKTYTKNGIRSPQKAILLITILSGIRDNHIKQNQIVLNGDLMTRFNFYWSRLVPKSFPFESNICQSYIHLGSDSFYNLKLKRPIPNINISWTIPLIKSYCHFAELSSALYVLAKDSESCLQLINALIDEFQLNSIVNIAENKFSYGRNHIKAFPNEKDFRVFLSTVKSETTHRALSSSSINVYASGTKSDYLVPFICRYEKTGDLFKIYDLHIIHKLIADVTNDIIASNRTSKVPIYILKLYFKYLQSLK